MYKENWIQCWKGGDITLDLAIGAFYNFWHWFKDASFHWAQWQKMTETEVVVSPFGHYQKCTSSSEALAGGLVCPYYQCPQTCDTHSWGYWLRGFELTFVSLQIPSYQVKKVIEWTLPPLHNLRCLKCVFLCVGESRVCVCLKCVCQSATFLQCWALFDLYSLASSPLHPTCLSSSFPSSYHPYTF